MARLFRIDRSTPEKIPAVLRGNYSLGARARDRRRSRLLDAHLCIGETALLTPAAHFIDARSIHFVDTQFQVAENFICFARITEAIFFAASGTQVREQELLDETGEHFLL